MMIAFQETSDPEKDGIDLFLRAETAKFGKGGTLTHNAERKGIVAISQGFCHAFKKGLIRPVNVLCAA